MDISRRMSNVQDPVIPVIRSLIEAHPGTLSLGQGVVFYGPPPGAFERMAAFGRSPGDHMYAPVQGLPALLGAVERKLRTENGIRTETGRKVMVTAGGNMGFLNALFAICDPDDEVILPLPFYFNQEMAVRMLNGRPVPVPTDAAGQLDLSRIEAAITPRTKAIVTISPNNPTGAVYPEHALRGVNRLCRERRIYHISDEAYECFLFDGAQHFSPGSIEGAERHTISLFSLSKAYGFASWRIGYMVIPDHLFNAVLKVQDTNLICPPVVSQHAAIGALEAGSAYCRSHLAALDHVRGIVLRELAALDGLCTLSPGRGAFYFLLHLPAEQDAMAVAERLIREHRVAVVPGTAFGAVSPMLRVSYGALTPETAREGTCRLAEGLRRILS